MGEVDQHHFRSGLLNVCGDAADMKGAARLGGCTEEVMLVLLQKCDTHSLSLSRLQSTSFSS